ncbi:MAG: hypothetical protein IGS48_11535 [Oscillatoriales cyanobacterium C42_A2020_001]|nr:hypothetical protein [Leptolyngbyaceae cyanobacterium C42_A2020_001]
MVRHGSTRSLQTVASILVLVSLVTGTEITTTASAIAANVPVSPSAVIATPNQSVNQPLAATPAKVPPEIVKTLRQDLSNRTGIPLGQLRFIEGSSHTWQNGCLGLARPDEMCTQMLVNGWRVVFANGSNRWVYRTDATGRTYRLEPATNRSESLPESPKSVNNLRPAHISANELPPKLQKDAVFRAIASGGFAGQTYQTTLYQNGRIVREQLRPNGTTGSPQVRQVSQQQVRQFIAMLRQNKLYRLHRADYRATPGSADFFTVTLSCQFCTIRYADSIQTELPSNLQAVIQAWNELTRMV